MKIKVILVAFILSILFSSCFSEDDFDNSKKGNFDALWQILDERYCFFAAKDVDWDEVYARYAPRVSEKMSNEALFQLMDEMLKELKDGHVNLSSAFNVARYTDWYDDYPRNFYIDLIEHDNYLGRDYKIASGLKYKVFKDNIGYVYYNSFSAGVGSGNLNEVLKYLLTCEGIIIDVRNNGGGMLTNSEKLASPFMKEKTLVGYMQHKTGKGHNDFSKPYEKHVEPFEGLSYLKKVVVLTNRRTYSAANDFVSAMRYAPNVKIFGDRTGGGGGMPFSSELPNGWSVRFSASPLLDRDMQQTEFGIEPDKKCSVTEEDRNNNIDPIIEAAKEYIWTAPDL